VYDYLLTFEHEVNLVWNAPWSILNVTYIFARYLPFIMIGMIGISSPFLILLSKDFPNLLKVYLSEKGSLLIGVGAAEAVVTIRTWAVCGRRRWLGIVLSFYFIGNWVGVVIVTSRFLDSMEFGLQKPLHPILHGCLITSANSNLLIIDWGLLFVFDAGMSNTVYIQ
ncbi:hypothetical protein BDQ17DRAFT_1513650, partial [Cyathus striatus]